MKTKQKNIYAIYAIVSKTQCCTGWNRSHEVLPYELGGKRQLPNAEIVKNDNIEDDTNWDEVYSGDWQYALYTVQEAVNELLGLGYWLECYKEEVISRIKGFDCDSLAFDKIIYDFWDYLDYIQENAHSHSKAHCLAEIAQKPIY